MTDNSIIYGDILSDSQRRQLERNYAQLAEKVAFREEATMFEMGEGSSLVFVDLENPRFSCSEFLLSLATAGKKAQIIGKVSAPTLDVELHFSKLGVSEILRPEQCLERLDSFLQSLEIDQADDDSNPEQFGLDALTGSSPKIAEIRQTVSLLKEVDFPSALILGETGTGKGLVSKVLHHTGLRAAHNLVEVNCSAIPDELFESELFGHAKGAFTDAQREKMGLFQYAQNGTLFLDEVGNLSASAQGKLLKILEDKRLRRVGDVDEIDVDVRVVAATNIDLKEAIASGSFREDLYFRLNLLTIEIPSLRERRADIPEIIEHFLKHYSSLYGKPRLRVSPSVVQQMSERDWPGNVRELGNVIERAVLLAQNGVIKVEDLTGAAKLPRLTAGDRKQMVIELPAHGISLKEIEQSVVVQVLDTFNWNKSEAARYLRISRPRLRRIIESAGLEQNRRKS
ncbi:MAG: sigma-54 interaction domain-containing protein [Candidatus Zixiibacteriota bacterium]